MGALREFRKETEYLTSAISNGAIEAGREKSKHRAEHKSPERQWGPDSTAFWVIVRTLVFTLIEIVESNIMSFLSKEILVTPFCSGFAFLRPPPLPFPLLPVTVCFKLANWEECAP